VTTASGDTQAGAQPPACLLIYNANNPAYERWAKGIAQHSRLGHRAIAHSSVTPQDFMSCGAVFLTDWGMVDRVPQGYTGHVLIGVYEPDSWIKDGQLNPYAAASFSKATALVVANNGFKSRLATMIPGKSIHVIPDGVDAALFKPEPWKKIDPSFTVGFVGANWRGDDHKGLSIAQEACRQAGVTRFEYLSAKFGESGYVPHDKMPDWYNSKIDVLLICSAGEGGPNPGLEAAACGLPVVSTPVGCMDRVLAPEWIVNRTAQDFAGALIALKNKGQAQRQAIGRENRNRIISLGFTREKTAEQFDAVVLLASKSAKMKSNSCIVEQFTPTTSNKTGIPDTTQKKTPHEIASQASSPTKSEEEKGRFKEFLRRIRNSTYINFSVNDFGMGGAQTAAVRYTEAFPEWIRDRSVIGIVWNNPEKEWNLERIIRDEHRTSAKICKTRDFPAPNDLIYCYSRYPEYVEKRLLMEGATIHLLLPSQHSTPNENQYKNAKIKNIFPISSMVSEMMSYFQRQLNARMCLPVTPPIGKPRMKRTVGWDGGRIRVLYAGRNSPDKGADSIPMILKMNKDMEFVVITGWDDSYTPDVIKWQKACLEKLSQEARILGVEDRMKIVPFKYTFDVSEIHLSENPDVFLAPSKSEGYGISLVEAVSCGIPVAVTDRGNADGVIIEGVNGSIYRYEKSPDLHAISAARAIRHAAKCDPHACSFSWGEVNAKSHDSIRYMMEELGYNLRPMIEHPLVTVAVRYHTTADRIGWLDQAMASVARQTFRGFKVLLAIDGLDSDAQKIALRYGVDYVCTNETPHYTHMSRSFRLAADKCGTMFFKPLDYDDILAPDYLEHAVESCAKGDYDLYCCQYYQEDKNGELWPSSWPRRPVQNCFIESTVPHPTAFLRTKSLLDSGNYLHTAEIIGADDWDVWRRMSDRGYRFYRDDSYHGAIYRKHENQTTTHDYIEVKDVKIRDGIRSELRRERDDPRCKYSPNNASPLTTIIVRYHATAKHPRLLSDVMECISRQTYRNFTTMLAFDGMEQDAKSIAAKYGISYVCTNMVPDCSHNGLAIRLAAERCTTKYIKPIDYDDLIDDDFMERAVSRIIRTESDLYCSRMKVQEKENGKVVNSDWPARDVSEVLIESVIPHLSVLASREKIIEAGNYLSETPKKGDTDADLWRRMFKIGCVFYRDELYHGCTHRIHDDNITFLLKNGGEHDQDIRGSDSRLAQVAR